MYWLAAFRLWAQAGFPDGVLEIESAPTEEELREARRIAREKSKAVLGIEYRPNGAHHRIFAKCGPLDSDPPPFLEQYPIALVS